MHGACALPIENLLKNVAKHSDSRDYHRPHVAGGLLRRTLGQEHGWLPSTWHPTLVELVLPPLHTSCTANQSYSVWSPGVTSGPGQ